MWEFLHTVFCLINCKLHCLEIFVMLLIYFQQKVFYYFIFGSFMLASYIICTIKILPQNNLNIALLLNGFSFNIEWYNL